MVEGVEIALEDPDQVDHRIGAVHRARHRLGLADVGGDQLGLAQIAQRLHILRDADVALGDAHAGACCGEALGDVPSQKSAAAKDRDQCVAHGSSPVSCSACPQRRRQVPPRPVCPARLCISQPPEATAQLRKPVNALLPVDKFFWPKSHQPVDACKQSG